MPIKSRSDGVSDNVKQKPHILNFYVILILLSDSTYHWYSYDIKHLQKETGK